MVISLAAGATSAVAAPIDGLTGKLALGSNALPAGKKKSPRAYAQAFKRRARGRAVFHQDPATGSWKIYYATVSKRPVRDATITLIDVSHGRKLVGQRDTILYTPGRVVQGSLTLQKREVVDPNSRLLMVIESEGRVLARRPLYIQGKAPRTKARRRNQTIDFTEETHQARSQPISIEAVRNRHR
ncbi:MAG TPA: hypothetical protein VMZ28_11685 [Kofleriaceae bacterium]|nr:hypothetical protein [Kofleriaceae bacterium]